MPSRKRKDHTRRAPAAAPYRLCDELFEDDGVDPREDTRRDAALDQKPDRKLRQLCKQVAQALQLALAALPAAAALAGVFVREVRPAPHAGRLCAVIEAPDPRRAPEIAAILQQYAGRLRGEVAAAITRRRAPELTFEVVSASASAPEGGLDVAPEGGLDEGPEGGSEGGMEGGLEGRSESGSEGGRHG